MKAWKDLHRYGLDEGNSGHGRVTYAIDGLSGRGAGRPPGSGFW